MTVSKLIDLLRNSPPESEVYMPIPSGLQPAMEHADDFQEIDGVQALDGGLLLINYDRMPA
jgi:hypothetical protein